MHIHPICLPHLISSPSASHKSYHPTLFTFIPHPTLSISDFVSFWFCLHSRHVQSSCSLTEFSMVLFKMLHHMTTQEFDISWTAHDGFFIVILVYRFSGFDFGNEFQIGIRNLNWTRYRWLSYFIVIIGVRSLQFLLRVVPTLCCGTYLVLCCHNRCGYFALLLLSRFPFDFHPTSAMSMRECEREYCMGHITACV